MIHKWLSRTSLLNSGSGGCWIALLTAQVKFVDESLDVINLNETNIVGSFVSLNMNIIIVQVGQV